MGLAGAVPLPANRRGDISCLDPNCPGYSVNAFLEVLLDLVLPDSDHGPPLRSELPEVPLITFSLLPPASVDAAVLAAGQNRPAPPARERP